MKDKKSNKKNFSNNKKFTNKGNKMPFQKIEILETQIKDIHSGMKKVSIIAKVNRIVQTGGPTIFAVSDGTGSFSIKGFVGPGERAYPELNVEDVVKAVISIGEFQGEIEGEIIKIHKVSEEENKFFLKKIEKIERERAKIIPPEFLVKTPILEKLRDKFIEAATQIRLAIIQDRPIIVRHHNDCDGYSSGFSLERAIIPLIEKQHNDSKAAWEFYIRAPCQAPYYEIDDSIRDTANSLRNAAKFSNKIPLIIIADNGSTEDDLMAIKQGKVHGSDFIVIDHHQFDKDVISEEVLVHINPFLVGESGSEISAGMLCTELSRFINPDVENIIQIAAMSGYDDRIDLAAPETMSKYMKLAEKEGYTKELLDDISLVINYISSKVRFMEVREYIEVLFGEPRNKQKELVSLLAPYIKELDKKGLAIGISNTKKEKRGNIVLQTINIDETFPGFGFFPKPGRSVSLIHENYINKNKDARVVTAGVMATAMTIRASDSANFSFHDLKHYIEENSPESFVSGGGHKNAGSLNFLPYKKEKVLELFKEFVGNIK